MIDPEVRDEIQFLLHPNEKLLWADSSHVWFVSKKIILYLILLTLFCMLFWSITYLPDRPGNPRGTTTFIRGFIIVVFIASIVSAFFDIRAMSKAVYAVTDKRAVIYKQNLEILAQFDKEDLANVKTEGAGQYGNVVLYLKPQKFSMFVGAGSLENIFIKFNKFRKIPKASDVAELIRTQLLEKKEHYHE